VLVAHQPLPDRLQLGLGVGLLQLQVGDRGVRRDQIGGERGPDSAYPGQLRMLGERLPAVLQLGQRRVEQLEIQQP
jgi:hypothetical protein